MLDDSATTSDGYGGMSPILYEAIMHFKKTGEYPDFADIKERRNAHFHWRNRCNNFSLAENDLVMYTGNKNTSENGRVVVRLEETRLALRYIHEKIGHGGQKQTASIVARRLYWRSMRRDITKFIQECEVCKKKRELRKPGVLLSDIEMFPSNAAEDMEMTAVAQRLLLNSEDGMRRELEQFEVYEYLDDGYGEVLDEMDEDELLSHHPIVSHRYNAPGTSNTILREVKDERDKMNLDDENETIVVTEEYVPAVENTEIVCSVEESDEGSITKRGTKRRMDEDKGENSPITKRRLQEENEELRDRLRVAEASLSNVMSNGVNGVQVIPPSIDPEIVQLQKNVLELQQEVLILKRQYLRGKIAALQYMPAVQYVDDGHLERRESVTPI